MNGVYPTRPTNSNNAQAFTTGHVDRAELRRALRLIFTLHQVIEIRALRVQRGFGRPFNVAGFFDNADAAELAVLGLPLSKAVYWTLNAFSPDLLAIRANRLDAGDEAGLTADKHITRRLLLLVDFDPERPHAEISSTRAEHLAAQELAGEVIGAMAEEYGWPLPVLFNSGNGFGLWYRIDLPADDGGMVKRVLVALAARFSTLAVKIDTAVANAARITKLPGAMARKGDAITERPHRIARIISRVDSFDEVDILTAAQLQAFSDAFAPVTPTLAPSKIILPAAGKLALDRCITYLMKLPESIQGQHGSERLYHACCICFNFGLSMDEAQIAIAAYNASKCTPQWSEREIEHKLQDAEKAVDTAGERASMVRNINHQIALRGKEVRCAS